MGCNCKTTENIIKLHKEYGKEIDIPNKKKILFKIKESIKYTLVLLIGLISLPIIFIIVLSLTFSGKRYFNISKIINRLLRKK